MEKFKLDVKIAKDVEKSRYSLKVTGKSHRGPVIISDFGNYTGHKILADRINETVAELGADTVSVRSYFGNQLLNTEPVSLCLTHRIRKELKNMSPDYKVTFW